jgi:hypothetical protein
MLLMASGKVAGFRMVLFWLSSGRLLCIVDCTGILLCKFLFETRCFEECIYTIANSTSFHARGKPLQFSFWFLIYCFSGFAWA